MPQEQYFSRGVSTASLSEDGERPLVEMTAGRGGAREWEYSSSSNTMVCLVIAGRRSPAVSCPSHPRFLFPR